MYQDGDAEDEDDYKFTFLHYTVFNDFDGSCQNGGYFGESNNSMANTAPYHLYLVVGKLKYRVQV